MRKAQFTENEEILSSLDLASTKDLETVIFTDPNFLSQYIENIFQVYKEKELTYLESLLLKKLKIIRQLYIELKHPPKSLSKLSRLPLLRLSSI